MILRDFASFSRISNDPDTYLLPDDVKNRVDELGTLSVVSLGPVVPGACLAENKVVWAKNLPVRPCTDRVHSSRLQVNEDGPRHVAPTSGLVVVHVDAVELELALSAVLSGRINPMLVGNDLEICHVGGVRRQRNEKVAMAGREGCREARPETTYLPELGTDLVSTLTSL